MSGKTGWLCYAKKSVCDILYKKMKSKNVSLVVEIYPREGTETPKSIAALILDNTLKFIPVRGRKLEVEHAIISKNELKFIPVRGRKPFSCFTA